MAKMKVQKFCIEQGYVTYGSHLAFKKSSCPFCLKHQQSMIIQNQQEMGMYYLFLMKMKLHHAKTIVWFHGIDQEFLICIYVVGFSMQIALQLCAGSGGESSSPHSIPNSIHTKVPLAVKTHKQGMMMRAIPLGTDTEALGLLH